MTTYEYAVIPGPGMHGSGDRVRAVYRTDDLARAHRKAEQATSNYRAMMAPHGGSSGGYRVVEWRGAHKSCMGVDADRMPTV